jgi:hypothetical protein
MPGLSVSSGAIGSQCGPLYGISRNPAEPSGNVNDGRTHRDKTGSARGKGAGALQTGVKALNTAASEPENVIPDTSGFHGTS